MMDEFSLVDTFATFIFANIFLPSLTPSLTVGQKLVLVQFGGKVQRSEYDDCSIGLEGISNVV